MRKHSSRCERSSAPVRRCRCRCNGDLHGIGVAPPPPDGQFDREAALLADLLTEGVKQAVAARVVDYLGGLGMLQPYRSGWDASGCEALAEAARRVLGLRQWLHEVTGEAVSGMLRPGTPDFHRALVRKIAAKVPLPTDAKLEAIARGLLLIGIYMCIVLMLPECACLSMLGERVVKEQAQRYVEDLLDQTARDLRGVA